MEDWKNVIPSYEMKSKPSDSLDAVDLAVLISESVRLGRFYGTVAGMYFRRTVLEDIARAFRQKGWEDVEFAYDFTDGVLHWAVIGNDVIRSLAFPECGMTYEPTSSSVIKMVTWDIECNGVVVEIKQKEIETVALWKTYLYLDVPFAQFVEWTKAESAGKFYNAHIKAKPYIKLEDWGEK